MKKETKAKRDALLKKQAFLYKIINNMFKCNISILIITFINIAVIFFIDESEWYLNTSLAICVIGLLNLFFCLIFTMCIMLIRHKLKKLQN